MADHTGIRRLFAPQGLRVMPLASVLPRATQAVVSLQLARGLAAAGRRVVLLDASPGDLAAALEMRAPFELEHLLAGERSFDEVALDAGGVRVVPAERGLASLALEDAAVRGRLFAAFTLLGDPADTVLINPAARDTALACRAAAGGHEVLLVVADGQRAVTDAYALIKMARREHAQRRFRLLFARVLPGFVPDALATRMAGSAARFAGAEIQLGGVLPLGQEVSAARDIARASAAWNFPEYPLAAEAA